MKIKSITVNEFKRFHHLKVVDLPESAKLVVLLGPNGCGKSSLFDAIHSGCRRHFFGMSRDMGSYYDNNPERSSYTVINKTSIVFHNVQPQSAEDWQKSVYSRSAYRNTPSFQFDNLGKIGPALQEPRITRMIDNDQVTGTNYQRLISNAIERIFDDNNKRQNLEEFRESIISEIRKSVSDLFPKLILNNLGNPLSGKSTFRFNKGKTRGYTYENLSGGEKSAFDLILDIAIKKEEFNDTVYCIDEPEAHMSMKVQGKLLSVLYKLIPDNCQLWIATHSIGMMREAQKIQKQCPDKVVFLDFDKDFDEPQTINPTQMNRALWEKIHSVALEDLSELVAPEQIVLCESSPDKKFDEHCYNNIFSPKYPNVRFVSVGGTNDTKKVCGLISNIMESANLGTKIIPLRDRDGLLPDKRNELIKNGTRVLTRKKIEDYLVDDEVLDKFAKNNGLTESQLAELKGIKKSGGNGKEHAGKIYQKVRYYGLNIGDDKYEFLQDVIAPLIAEYMEVYQELEKDIFGDCNVNP